jgi:hypothetical protein
MVLFVSFYSNCVRSMEPGGRIVVGLGSTVTALETLAADKIRASGFKYVTEELFRDLRLDAIVNPTIPLEVRTGTVLL